jgi:hypothetical protein
MSGIINQSFSRSKVVDEANDTCKMFCNFSMTNESIHHSYNVAGCTDGGTGITTVNFIKPIPTDYVGVTSFHPDYTSGNITSFIGIRTDQSTSTSVRVHGRRESSQADNSYCQVAIFRKN